MPVNNVCSICGNRHSNLQRGINGAKYCPDCINEHHLIRCSADDCGKYMKPEEAFLSGQGYLCEEHWKAEYAFCDACGAIIRKRYGHRMDRGMKFICEHCFSVKYFECEDCGCTHKISEANEVEVDGTVRKVCKSCLEENYSTCPSCGKLKRNSSIINARYINANGEKKIINGCEECVAKVCHSCSHCGGWFANEIPFHDEGTCDKCYYGGNIIHNYSYKPKAVVQKSAAENTDLLFGIENEIELKFNDPNRSRYENDGDSFTIETKSGSVRVDYRRFVAFHVESSIPGLFYQKNDGSIRFGMEIVSHPATLEFWRSNKDRIEELFSFLRSEGCAGDEASTVGMHIHVTRNGMTRAHQNSFAAFVYSHKEKIEKLAGRRSNGYTKMIPLPNSAEDNDQTKRFEEKIINNHDRYSAVNWNNEHTVELRMFQSTLNTSHFLANIEFSHALYHFSKTRTVLECVNNDSWKNFCGFIAGNYEYLASLMMEKGIYVS